LSVPGFAGPRRQRQTSVENGQATTGQWRVKCGGSATAAA